MAGERLCIRGSPSQPFPPNCWVHQHVGMRILKCRQTINWPAKKEDAFYFTQRMLTCLGACGSDHHPKLRSSHDVKMSSSQEQIQLIGFACCNWSEVFLAWDPSNVLRQMILQLRPRLGVWIFGRGRKTLLESALLGESVQPNSNLQELWAPLENL